MAPRISLGGTYYIMPAGLAASDVVDALNTLTAKSQSCQGPANQITIINVALAVTGQGPIPVIIEDLILLGSQNTDHSFSKSLHV